MSDWSSVKYSDFDGMTEAELYKKGKSGRDLLFKRMRRLEANVASKPEQYSSHGLDKMKEEGIPMISTKMNKRELKVNLLKIERMKEMKTSTSRGAKKNMNQLHRLIAGAPQEGRLKVDESKRVSQVQSYIQQDPDFISDFFSLYKYFKEEIKFRGYYDPKFLDEFRDMWENELNKGYSIGRMRQVIENIANDEYHETQRRNQRSRNIGRAGGRFQ